jgi:hypothetical protein
MNVKGDILGELDIFSFLSADLVIFVGSPSMLYQLRSSSPSQTLTYTSLGLIKRNYLGFLSSKYLMK